MRDYVNDHLAAYPGPIRPQLFTKRGAGLSIQASRGHYCDPREDNAPHYTHVEVWWCGRAPDCLRPYQSPAWA